MSDITCSDCGYVMDQSDACTHVCPPNPLRDRLDALESLVDNINRELAKVRHQVRVLVTTSALPPEKP